VFFGKCPYPVLNNFLRKEKPHWAAKIRPISKANRCGEVDFPGPGPSAQYPVSRTQDPILPTHEPQARQTDSQPASLPLGAWHGGRVKGVFGFGLRGQTVEIANYAFGKAGGPTGCSLSAL